MVGLWQVKEKRVEVEIRGKKGLWMGFQGESFGFSFKGNGKLRKSRVKEFD